MQKLEAREIRKNALTYLSQRYKQYKFIADRHNNLKQRFENIDGLSYVKVIDKKTSTEAWFSFDITNDTVLVAGYDPSDPTLADALNVRIKENKLALDKIDYKLLYEIKSRNKGTVYNMQSPEDMFRIITDTYTMDDDAKTRLKNLIDSEIKMCNSFNRATHVYMGLDHVSKSGFQIHFSVKCTAITYQNSYNWHGQNISQWLYAGCIQGLAYDDIITSYDISSHH